MGKLTVIGLVWLVVFAVTLIFIDEQLSMTQTEQTSNGSQEAQDADNSQLSGFVELHVEGYFVNNFWKRGNNDLPMLSVAINYTVENVGNVSASTVTIETSLDATCYSNKTIYNLMPDSEYAGSVVFSVDYDQLKIVEIEASYGNVTDSWSQAIDAELPRHSSWDISELFITPDEHDVQSTRNEIVGGMFFVSPYVDWIVIRDWVGRNIEYVNDYESYGVEEFWQLGKETLESRKGDCEDFAILLCSLLRADGWGVEDVYVVVGQNEAGDYHAWVKIKIPLVGWYNIEPQLNGWNTLLGDFVALHGFTAIYNFNDQYFIEV